MQTLGLSVALARANFKLEIEGSYLGLLWYILNPLAMFIILLFVFSSTIGSTISQYPLYLLLGIIMFNVFRHITVESTKIIYNNRLLIKSIPFEYHALVLAVVIRNLFSHIFEIGIFFIIAHFFGVSFIGVFAYGVILIIFLGFTYGLSLFLAAVSVYIIDLENIWGTFTQALWFATPIFYVLGENSLHGFISQANPVYHAIHAARSVIINGTGVDFHSVTILFGFAIVAILLGEYSFKRLSTSFAERF